jgi:hypothetical protein
VVESRAAPLDRGNDRLSFEFDRSSFFRGEMTI